MREEPECAPGRAGDKNNPDAAVPECNRSVHFLVDCNRKIDSSGGRLLRVRIMAKASRPAQCGCKSSIPTPGFRVQLMNGLTCIKDLNDLCDNSATTIYYTTRSP